jgi:tyrosinase
LSNVDRLFAIWQFLNPDKWFGKGPTPTPDGTEPKPEPTDDLLPFHINREGKIYNSNDARYCEKLGYTYQDLLKTTTEELKAELKKKYGKHTVQLLPDHGKAAPGIGTETFPDYLINIEYDRYVHIQLSNPLALTRVLQVCIGRGAIRRRVPSREN